jgi:DNA-binding Xre family transcriptional regulator
MTAYRLSQLAGLSLPTVYRLVKPDETTRLELETLDKLCSALKCEISDLLVRTK